MSWAEIKLVKNPPYEKGKNSMVSIKMLKTQSGSSDGITVNVYSAGCVYPSATVPLSEDLKGAFIGMGAAEEVEIEEPVTEPIEPEKTQTVAVAPKTKAPKIQDMNKTELHKFIEESGIEVGNEKMSKKDLQEIAKDIVNDNS